MPPNLNMAEDKVSSGTDSACGPMSKNKNVKKLSELAKTKDNKPDLDGKTKVFTPKRTSSKCFHLWSDSEEITSHTLTDDDIARYMKKYDFTQSEILEFEEAFLVFDIDGDGVITVDELGTVMAALRQRPSLQELEALIRGVDNDNSGTVDFDEFLNMMSKRMHTDPEAELHEVFRVFDANDDGFISADELYEVLSRLDDGITKDEVEGMIKEADVNGDGKVDFSEFKNILHAK